MINVDDCYDANVISYLEYIKRLHIQHKVLYMDECTIDDIKEYLREGNNIFLITNCSRVSRQEILQSIRKMCKMFAIRCWYSIMLFEKIEEMPDEKEGWNDILLNYPQSKNIKQIKCHDRLI